MYYIMFQAAPKMSPLKSMLLNTPSFVVFLEGCPYCIRAMNLLNQKNIPYQALNYGKYPELDAEITATTKHRTYPKIYLDRKFVGGCDDLMKYLEKNNTL